MIAIDNSPLRLALARHNAALYGVVDRIEFILADFVSFATALANSQSQSKRRIDAVFLSPPWGGIDYLTLSASKASDSNGIPPATPVGKLPGSAENVTENGEGGSDEPFKRSEPLQYRMENMSPLHGKELFRLARQITPHVAFFLPRNQDLCEVADLVAPMTSGHNSDRNNGNHKVAEAREVELVEVEEEWMGNKLKALTCYFGGLAQGQEHLWS